MAAKIDHDDLITCPICFEHFTNPKQLPCFHTFCHPCLKSYIVTHLGGEGQKGQDFPCPVCRQVVSVTDKTLSSEKIADAIPGNHLIACLMERLRGTDKSQKPKICDPCSRDSKHSTASFWCTWCLETLCENCTASHKRLNQSRHVLIPVEEIAEPDKALDMDEPCMKHTGEVMKVYCLDHKETCCVICLATSHRRCDNISTFDEMVNGSKDTETFELFNNQLSEMDKKSDDLRVKLEENLDNLTTKHEEITQNVSSTIQKAKDKLDQLQTKFEQKFQQKHKEESFKVTEKKDRVEIFQNSVKKGRKLLQAVREHGSPKQQFITKVKIKQQLKEQMKSLEEDLQDVICVDYTLKDDGALTTLAQSVDSMAEVTIKTDPDLTRNLKDMIRVIQSLCICEADDAARITQNPVDIEQLEVTKLSDITAQNEELTGGTHLPDGRIVLCNYTNSKLLLYDMNGKHLLRQKRLQKPTDACYLTDNQIVVAFYGQNNMKKYKVTHDAFLEICEIKCKASPWGLAATKDTIIVGFRGQIDVLSFDGKFIKTLSTRQGNFLPYVAVSPTGDVYYSDGDTIICKSQDDTELARYTHPQLKCVFGVAVDKFGFVYACGYNSNNLAVFSPDGSSSKILLEQLENPCKVGFDTKGETFFLANGRWWVVQMQTHHLIIWRMMGYQMISKL